MNKRMLFKLFFITILLMITLSAGTLAAPGDENQALVTSTTTRVSVASDGTQANDQSLFCSVSADGRYVTFYSAANNLVNGDTNAVVDVFLHDQQSGTTSRVSVASDGTQANGLSAGNFISADGRYVTFFSTASNLVSGDTNGQGDAFVHDRQSGTTSRVSVSTDGTQGNGESIPFSISADGRYLAFSSTASNLVSGDTNSYGDVFVHDRQSGTTSRVSVASDGTQGNGDSYEPSISADGRYVAFASWARNLVNGDTNYEWDIFVHDRQSGTTSRVSVASDGTQGDDYSYHASISADGRYVAFISVASNLISGDTNNEFDIFVHDRQSGTTSRVSVASDGTQGNGESRSNFISADGRYVAFSSAASNLVNGDTNNTWDIFVHDRQSGTTSRVSVSTDGTQGNGESSYTTISADGRYVAFVSWASNLVNGDTNNTRDIFVHDRGTPSLAINYTSGAPGSYFNIIGSDYPINENASVSINGTSLGDIPISGTGTFTITLSTGNADEGSYYVTVSVNPKATIYFTLDASDPTQPREGSYTIFDVPAGIAYTDEIFLPFVSR